MPMTIWAFRGRRALVRFRTKDWADLLDELARRGAGVREAGAFLLAARHGDPRVVKTAMFFDDLDPDCLRGGIALDGRAFSRLYDLCRRDRLAIIGDVHTHPGPGVEQSSIDAANPMVARAGHVALIVPHLAQHRPTPQTVGVHQYDGVGWTSWFGHEAARRVFVRRFV